MSQTPGGVQVAVPSKTLLSGRAGIIQVIQNSPTPTTHSLIKQSSPVLRPESLIQTPASSNTAIQYIRKPTAITVLNAGNNFVTSTIVQTFTPYGTPLMSINPGMMQSLTTSTTGLVPSGGNQVSGSGGPVSALSRLANSRKPCNCTKSHCLKLYCECFAQGQLCQNCNCNNCMNNLAYEEERGRAIKMTLERNPTAFHPKIGRGEGERKHTKGCNCKRSGCLKNYCECYEAKISCSDLCRCQSCRNTEDSVERRSLLRLAAMGSLRSRQPSALKKHLAKPHPETLPHVFFTWEVVEATAGCLLAQAEEAERRDLTPADQERIVLEEFGRILEHVIESASKAQIRPSNPLVQADSEEEASVLPRGDYTLGTSDVVGPATAAAAAADVLLSDDEDDDEVLREINVMGEDDPDDDIFDEDMDRLGPSRRHLSKRSRRVDRQRNARSRDVTEVESDMDDVVGLEDEHLRRKHRRISKKQHFTGTPGRPRRTTAASGGRAHDPDDMV